MNSDIDFHYELGQFYKQSEVRKKLHLGNSSGIIPKKNLGIIIVFMSKKNKKHESISKSGKFNYKNIYHDFYNDATGNYHYTAQGQVGTQTIEKGNNKSLAKSNEEGLSVHLFRQHAPNANHQYVGEVEVIGTENSLQGDLKEHDRDAIRFILKPVGGKSISVENYSEDELLSREIESEISQESIKPSKNELTREIDKINKKIITQGPKKGQVSQKRTDSEFKRNKQIVKLLKIQHSECMICKIKHFETNNGSAYSDAAHIIPWSISQDDSVENIMILCPTFHKKFDHAKISEREKMYSKLILNHSKTKFKKPYFL